MAQMTKEQRKRKKGKENYWWKDKSGKWHYQSPSDSKPITQTEGRPVVESSTATSSLRDKSNVKTSSADIKPNLTKTKSNQLKGILSSKMGTGSDEPHKGPKPDKDVGRRNLERGIGAYSRRRKGKKSSGTLNSTATANESNGGTKNSLLPNTRFPGEPNYVGPDKLGVEAQQQSIKPVGKPPTVVSVGSKSNQNKNKGTGLLYDKAKARVKKRKGFRP